MLNAIKTQKIDNYILKDDAFVAISHFGNPIILTVAGRCDGEITVFEGYDCWKSIDACGNCCF